MTFLKQNAYSHKNCKGRSNCASCDSRTKTGMYSCQHLSSTEHSLWELQIKGLSAAISRKHPRATCRAWEQPPLRMSRIDSPHWSGNFTHFAILIIITPGVDPFGSGDPEGKVGFRDTPTVKILNKILCPQVATKRRQSRQGRESPHSSVFPLCWNLLMKLANQNPGPRPTAWGTKSESHGIPSAALRF